MNMQKFPLNVSLSIVLFCTLATSSIKANANPLPNPGNSLDSSGFGVGPTPGVGLPAGISVFIDGNNTAIINITSPQIVDRLRAIASNLVRTNSPIPGVTLDAREETNIVITIALGRPGADVSASQLQAKLEGFGVNSFLATNLTQFLLGLLNSPVAANPGTAIATTKDLKADFLLSQAQDVNVDINKLNGAIDVYNQIVQESSPVTLQKLSEDPDFLEISRILKELRGGL
ncbi:hypothetical protein VB711_16225 [Cronbergia sp. UHCC 0137]|uniref:hypothetical protein n=1 Tax=Cronbergia sp. UHCC 0137 TaxID=3110239 RepID=UPI002B20550F|nr:hypothetical protein [Cronbergia sp. UHCC 0137]MEA5619376.1 hypothetical protein [Cronbergia sp. UHCC 0137]